MWLIPRKDNEGGLDPLDEPYFEGSGSFVWDFGR